MTLTSIKQSGWSRNPNLTLKGATHAEHQLIKAADNNWRHMACRNAVEQPFIEYRDENIAVQ